jgi:hypothetical protein
LKKRGRPAKGLKYQITLFLTAAQYRRIEKLATEQDISFSEATRQLINLGIKTHDTEKEK